MLAKLLLATGRGCVASTRMRSAVPFSKPHQHTVRVETFNRLGQTLRAFRVLHRSTELCNQLRPQLWAADSKPPWRERSGVRQRHRDVVVGQRCSSVQVGVEHLFWLRRDRIFKGGDLHKIATFPRRMASPGWVFHSLCAGPATSSNV